MPTGSTETYSDVMRGGGPALRTSVTTNREARPIAEKVERAREPFGRNGPLRTITCLFVPTQLHTDIMPIGMWIRSLAMHKLGIR